MNEKTPTVAEVAEATKTPEAGRTGRLTASPINPVIDRKTVLRLPKGRKPKADKPVKAEVEETDYPEIETVTVKNRKGKEYSLDVGLFSHTGHLIPFENAATAIDYCKYANVGKSKAAKKAAKTEYKKLQDIHATIRSIAAMQGFDALDLKRLTVKRQKRLPDRRSVAIAGVTDQKIPAFETLAQATAQAGMRAAAIKAKAARKAA